MLFTQRFFILETLGGNKHKNVKNVKKRDRIKTFYIYGFAWGSAVLGAVLHSSYEPGKLLRWLRHYDSVVNIATSVSISDVIY